MTNSITSELIAIQNSTAQLKAKQAEGKTGASSELGQDAFLQLMMEQLKYQDPLEPMDNSEFLTQQAQFTQLSSIQNVESLLTQYNQYSQAASMMGKDVVIEDPNSGDYLYGNVEAVNLSSKNTTVVVGGKSYPLSSVVQIQSQVISNAENTANNNN